MPGLVTQPKVVAPSTYAVGAIDDTWVDTSRGTNANGKAPASKNRSFKVVVLYPAKGEGSAAHQIEGAAGVPGPWPLIIFSHGVTALGTDYLNDLREFASAGYVVVAPNYPLSNRNAPGGPTVADMPNQAKGDIPYLIDHTIELSKGSGVLHGLVDASRIGLAGHSLGAVTSLTAGYDPCCASKRVRAVAEWSGILVPLTKPFHVATFAAHRPLLIVHGTNDGTVNYAAAGGVYKELGTPKIEVSLPGEGHVPAFVIGRGKAAGEVVIDTTLHFFDAELKNDPTSLAKVKDVVTKAGPKIATIREDLG
jgi:dienelactone hydrolase